MNIFRNSMIIIQDYDYGTINNIKNIADTCFIDESVSGILWDSSESEYCIIITDSKNTIKPEVEQTVKDWCKDIYKDFLPQNITVLNIGEAGMSYIEYQFPKEEDYFK